jgi:hypothetical protein
MDAWLLQWYMDGRDLGPRNGPSFKTKVGNAVYSRKLVGMWTWCKNHLYSPAYKRRRAAKTLADAYRVYNAEFSTLHKLPGELILEVAD